MFPSLNSSPISNLHLFDSWINCCFPLTNPWTSPGLFPILYQQQQHSIACAIFLGQRIHHQRAPHRTNRAFWQQVQCSHLQMTTSARHLWPSAWHCPPYSSTWGKWVPVSSWRDWQAPPALVPSLAEKSKATATNLRNGRAGQQLSNEKRSYDKDQWNAMCRENCSTTYTAELCSQWLWISHVAWYKETISLQCIYLKPGDLRDCCCGISLAVTLLMCWEQTLPFLMKEKRTCRKDLQCLFKAKCLWIPCFIMMLIQNKNSELKEGLVVCCLLSFTHGIHGTQWELLLHLAQLQVERKKPTILAISAQTGINNQP